MKSSTGIIQPKIITPICVRSAKSNTKNTEEKKEKKLTVARENNMKSFFIFADPTTSYLPIPITRLKFKKDLSLLRLTDFFYSSLLLMLRTSVRPLHSVFTLFLMEKDHLTANFSRFGAGFILDSHLREAKEQVANINKLLLEVEEQKDKKKPPVLIEENCGSCYRK